MIEINNPRFSLGRLLATPVALEELQKVRQSIHELLARHVQGDWGCVDPEDAEANEQAIQDGSRILSAYLLQSGVKVWVITEAADDQGNRVATTCLLPEEY